MTIQLTIHSQMTMQMIIQLTIYMQSNDYTIDYIHSQMTTHIDYTIDYIHSQMTIQ